MSQCNDVGRTDGIVSRGERGGTSVVCNIDSPDLPPLVGLICATFVILKIILYQDFRFVRIVSLAPPAKQSAGPNGLITIPF